MNRCQCHYICLLAILNTYVIITRQRCVVCTCTVWIYLLASVYRDTAMPPPHPHPPSCSRRGVTASETTKEGRRHSLKVGHHSLEVTQCHHSLEVTQYHHSLEVTQYHHSLEVTQCHHSLEVTQYHHSLEVTQYHHSLEVTQYHHSLEVTQCHHV